MSHFLSTITCCCHVPLAAPLAAVSECLLTEVRLNFVFALSDANANDTGTYDVAVEVLHPSTGSQPLIKKDFTLKVKFYS